MEKKFDDKKNQSLRDALLVVVFFAYFFIDKNYQPQRALFSCHAKEWPASRFTDDDKVMLCKRLTQEICREKRLHAEKVTQLETRVTSHEKGIQSEKSMHEMMMISRWEDDDNKLRQEVWRYYCLWNAIRQHQQKQDTRDLHSESMFDRYRN